MVDLLIADFDRVFDLMATIWPPTQNLHNKKKVYVAFWKAYNYDLEELKKAIQIMSMRQIKYFPALSEIHAEMVWVDKLRPKKELDIPKAEDAAERLKEIMRSMKIRRLDF